MNIRHSHICRLTCQHLSEWGELWGEGEVKVTHQLGEGSTTVNLILRPR